MPKFDTFERGFLNGNETLVVTSKFGRRTDPVNGAKLTAHNGVDLRTGGAITLKSPVDGSLEVVPESAGDGFGNYVRIRTKMDGQDIVIYLSHLSSISVSSGRVQRGQVVGTTGKSGRSTGHHLHIGVKLNTVWVDPTPFLGDHWVIDLNNKPLHYMIEEDMSVHVYEFVRDLNNFRLMPPVTGSEPATTENSISSESETAPHSNKTVSKEKSTIARERLAPGIWQIIKLVIDHNIADKQVLDSGISTMTGSLINFFRKVCQEPFVELFGDTYGDQYCFVARRPPFDYDGISLYKRANVKSNPDDMYSYEQGEHAGRSWLIPDDIVRSQNLGFDSNTAYSWYYYLPKMDDVSGGATARMFIPAVFFPEYAAIWGSKPLSVSSNYFHFIKSGMEDISEDKTKSQNNNFIIRKAWDDLKYLVESNSYLPFSRSGTITIQGFRGVKRGVWIRYKGWRYYVDQVTHDYGISLQSVDYTTTLTLSRGLKEPFIDGVEIRGTNMSYFNLIDFGDAESKDITVSNWKENLAKWKVNIRVFNYFMSREYMLYPHRGDDNVVETLSAGTKLKNGR